MNRRQAITVGVTGGAAVVTGCSQAAAEKPPQPFLAKKEPKASKVLDAMEGLRKKIPPDTRPELPDTGLTAKGMEPYTLHHLAWVAEGLGVATKMECLMLLTYLKDSDLKLRFIAAHAIDKATKAYPSGMSVECFTDPGSVAHKNMLFRFLELIDRLPD